MEYHPAIENLLQQTKKNQLGQLQYIYSHRLNFGKIRTEENALWSFAPHDIAVMLSISGELPLKVSCVGSSFITSGLADVTMSNLEFESGIHAHIFVSWLNPFKEQKLVVTGSEKMAVFDDTGKNKLIVYDQKVDLAEGMPVLDKQGSEIIDIGKKEPLRSECEHFLSCIKSRKKPLTNSDSAIKVLKVLEACQQSMDLKGQSVYL